MRKLKVLLMIILCLSLSAFAIACTQDNQQLTKYVISINSVEQTYIVGAEVTAEVTAPTGKVFVGWSNGTEIVSNSNPYVFTASENVTLTATYEDAKYNITVTDGTGTGEYVYNSQVTITANEKTGYRFTGWKKDGASISETNTTFTINALENVTYAAQYIKVFTVVIDSQSQVYDDGAEVTATATAPTGKEFAGWSNGTEIVSTSNPYVFNASVDITLTSTFDDIKYTITVTDGTGTGEYVYNSQVTITASEKNGYRFDGWKKNGTAISEENSSFTINALENATYAAQYVKVYTIVINGSSDVYDEGDTVVAESATKSGRSYRWIDEDGEVISTSTLYMFTASSDLVINAEYFETHLNTTYTSALFYGNIEDVTAIRDNVDPAAYGFGVDNETPASIGGKSISYEASNNFQEYTYKFNKTIDASKYQAVKFTVYVSDVTSAKSWHISLGIMDMSSFTTVGALNVMDRIGLRWDNGVNSSNAFTAGWNTVILPLSLQDVDAYGGFVLAAAGRSAIGNVDSFGIRCHSGSGALTLKIAAVEFINLSKDVKCGIYAYDTKDASYLYQGNGNDLQLYVGTERTYDAKLDYDAPYDVTGRAVVYSNYENAATYTYLTGNTVNANGYSHVRFVVWVDAEGSTTDMQVQLGVVSSKYILNNGSLVSANCLDGYGNRFENVKGTANSLKAGWNELILPLNSLDNVGGFSRSDFFSQFVGKEADVCANIDGFAIRVHTIGNAFSMKVYSVNFVNDVDSVAQVYKHVEEIVLTNGIASEDPISLVVKDAADLSVYENTTAFENSYTAYGNEGWGAFFKILKFENAGYLGYNGSLSNAISFYIYIGNQDTLTGFRNQFAFDLSSSTAYSDAAKYSWNATRLFDSCKIGWNKIILLFNKADEYANLNTTNIYSARINASGSGIAGGKVSFKICNIQLIKSDLTANAAESENTGTQPTTDPFETVTMSVSNPTSLTAVANDEAFKEKFTSYKIENGSSDAPVMVLDGNYDGTGSNALQFYVYIGDQTTLTKFTTQFAFDLCSNTGDYTDNNKLSWAIAPLFANCQIGWNKITLLYSAADEKISFDSSTVHTLRLNYSGCGGSSDLNFKIGNLKLVETSFTANKAEKEPGPFETVTMSVSNPTSLTAVANDEAFKEKFTSYKKENGSSDAPVMVLDGNFDGTGSNALQFYVYIGDQTTLTKFTTQFAFDLCSNTGDYTDSYKLSWAIAPLFANCQVGWNKITLLYSAANEKNSFDSSTVHTLRLNYSGCGGSGDLNFKIGNLKLVDTSLTANTAEKEVTE